MQLARECALHPNARELQEGVEAILKIGLESVEG
jgi:hypothetical protein